MALRIRENLERVRRDIENGTGPVSGAELADLAIQAMFEGIGTFDGDVVIDVNDAWKDLMKVYAPVEGSNELRRLCGEDLRFNRTTWGRHCLAYVAGDSTCTIETAGRGGTQRSMILVDQILGEQEPPQPPRRMLELLDAEEDDLEMLDAQARAAFKDAKESRAQRENSGNTYSPDTDASNDKS